MRTESATTPPMCEFCGKRDRIVTKYDLDTHRILRCRWCSFMWLDPRPTYEDLEGIYDGEYYSNESFFDGDASTLYGYANYVEEHATRCKDLGRIVLRVLQLLGPNEEGCHKSLLDCGCGLGYLLEVAHRHGFAVEGIERNTAAVELIADRYQFPVFAGDLLDYADTTQFDVVTMLDVIEHLHAPFEALNKIASLTKPGGLVVVSTMDSDSIVSRVMGRRLEDFRRVSEHLYFFNRRTISEALGRAGFDVVAIDWYGVSLSCEMLSKRVSLAHPRIGQMLERMIARVRLSSVNVHFNPRTKMVVYARRVA